MTVSLLGVLYLAGFFQAVVFIGILLKRSNKNQPGFVLALLLFVLAYKLLEGGFIHSSLFRSFPHVLDLLPPGPLLMGPLCYAYVRKMSNLPSWTLTVWLLHLLPAIILFGMNLPNLFMSSEDKILMWERVISSEFYVELPAKFIALLVLIKIILATYLALSWMQLTKLESHAEDTLSDDSGYAILWLKRMVLVFIFIELAWLVLFALQHLNALSSMIYIGKFWLLLVASVVLLMSYWGLQHPDRIIESIDDYVQKLAPKIQDNSKQHTKILELIDKIPDTTLQKKSERYANSPLCETTSEQTVQLIRNALQSEQLFLQPGLKLTELAEVVGIRPHLVSQVINETLQTKFNALVNRYRVEFAKELIDKRQTHLNIEQIAIESGFNNRVTFNKAFKTLLGMSPSVYKENNLSN